MNKAWKGNIVAALLIFVGMAVVQTTTASPIKNWTSNEYVTYTDLNNNFNHLHANLGHGHGPIITAYDISPSAGIRPEQTTFGRNFRTVHEGTYVINPDGGNSYLPINYSGSLTVEVLRIADTGFGIVGTPVSGLNPDGGARIYTVAYAPFGSVTNDGGILYCNESGPSTLNRNSGIGISTTCISLERLAAGFVVTRAPIGVTVQVYDNSVVQ